MDFTNAQLPTLAPLQGSFAVDEIEHELKQIFIDLFDANLATDLFDANVLGAAHLGTFDLVRKSVNADGLVLLQGDGEEAATRYLYRAWKSRNNDGRGLHFLRTYLQLLFPNASEVNQLWQDKTQPYPKALVTDKPRENYWLYYLGEPGLKVDGGWKVGGRRLIDEDEAEATRVRDLSGFYLTSRIEISLDFSVKARSSTALLNMIRAVIPARLLPIFRFWLRLLLDVTPKYTGSLLMQKNIDMRYPFCGLVITDNPERKWKLGIDGELVKLPQPFGTFRLGEIRGGYALYQLKSCRITSNAVMQSMSDIWAWRVETLPLDEISPARLTLSGNWKLGGARNPEFNFNVFKI
jgi:hypothetical protein